MTKGRLSLHDSKIAHRDLEPPPHPRFGHTLTPPEGERTG